MINDTHANGTTPAASGLTVFFITGFLVCFVAAGLVSQVYSGIHPTKDYSPLDYFTGGALWAASAVALVMAISSIANPLRLVCWLGGCMALSVLAIDEFMGMHEATQDIVGDDDHSKVALWVVMPFALFTVWRLERPGALVGAFFLVGFALQSLYLTVDIGDGDYFTLPVALATLQWVEDISELFFVSTYLGAFLLMLSQRTELAREMPLRTTLPANLVS